MEYVDQPRCPHCWHHWSDHHPRLGCMELVPLPAEDPDDFEVCQCKADPPE